MSYCLVTTRKTLDNPGGQLRYLSNVDTEAMTLDWRQALNFADRERVNGHHWQLRNPSNWNVLPWPPKGASNGEAA
jgi:hypothetical protein